MRALLYTVPNAFVLPSYEILTSFMHWCTVLFNSLAPFPEDAIFFCDLSTVL